MVNWLSDKGSESHMVVSGKVKKKKKKEEKKGDANSVAKWS